MLQKSFFTISNYAQNKRGRIRISWKSQLDPDPQLIIQDSQHSFQEIIYSARNIFSVLNSTRRELSAF